MAVDACALRVGTVEEVCLLALREAQGRVPIEHLSQARGATVLCSDQREMHQVRLLLRSHHAHCARSPAPRNGAAREIIIS